MFVNLLALAQQAGGKAPAGNWLVTMGPLVIIAVMFFFLFRSQSKEKKRRQEMLSTIKVGDKVVTAGGIHASVVSVKDKTLVVKIADNVKVEINRAAVGHIAKPATEEK